MAENYGSLEGVLDANETLEGEIDSHDEMSGEIQFSGGENGVRDVQVNNESVVDANKVAHIDLTPYAEKEDVYDKQTIDTALEGKADTDDIPENIIDLSDVAVDNIQNGQILKWDATQNKFVNANESGGGSGDVADVKVNGTSVVDPVTKEANIDLTGYAETSDIPTDLADLSDDATHRLVTDTEKAGWDAKADTSDIPTVNNNTITIQKNGQNVDSFTLNQNSNKAINIAVPTKTSDLQNDSSFITNTVNNLANYYLKSDTYTQTEVNNLISAAVNGRFEKVTTLPASGEPNIIYLVPKATPETSNACDEYIWQDNDWELIGSTNIDLSGYVTDDELTTALQDYLTTSAFNTAIANYYTKTEVGNLLDDKVDKVSGKGLSTYDYDATAKGIVDNVTTNLAGKVDKVNGKGLSTEDYTTTEKNKLAGISTGANKVESSTTNGNIRIDGTETQVYDGSGKVDKVNGKGLSTNDYDNTDKAKVDKIDTTTTSISGNPISISGLKANQLAVNPIITLEPIQAGSGTPSPSNIRAISGYDKIEVLSVGANIFGGELLADSIVSAVNNASNASKGSDSDGKYVTLASGSALTDKIFTNNVRFKENTQYSLILKAKKSNTDARLNLLINYTDGTTQDISKPTASTSLESFVVTTTANKTIKNISTAWQAGTAYLYYEYCGIFEGIKTTSDYVPYVKATSISESLGQTVYGGSLDVRTGVLTVTHRIVDLGSIDWDIVESTSSYKDFRNISMASNIKPVDSQVIADAVCEIFEITSRNEQSTNHSLNTIAITLNGYIRVITNTSYADAAAFKTAMSGKMFAYELATPFTIQLTPHEISLLKDYAYVSTNGTNIVLDYHNGELASLADVSQLGETVNELGEYVGRNNLGHQSNIQIPESGDFVCPSDGYIVVRSGNNASDFYRVDIYGNKKTSTNRFVIKVNSTTDSASKYQIYSVYVRKGMIATFNEKSSGNTTGSASFVSLE